MEQEEHEARQYLEIGKDVPIEDATEPVELHLDREQAAEAMPGRPGFFDWAKVNAPDMFCPEGHLVIHLEPPGVKDDLGEDS